MKRRTVRLTDAEGMVIEHALYDYEMAKRRRYKPEEMIASQNPEYWQRYLDNIASVRLTIRKAFEDEQ